jgi:two-component system nitrate/nitrite response regulator NarL
MEPSAMVQALQAGFDGLCATAMSRVALVKALELVMLGEPFISSAFAFSLFNQADCQQQTSMNGAAVSMSDTGSAAAAPANKLSNREMQILRYLTHGASNKHIARELGLTEATIKVHIKAILRKVKAANRTQAAMWAQQHMNLAANGVVLAAAE